MANNKEWARVFNERIAPTSGYHNTPMPRYSPAVSDYLVKTILQGQRKAAVKERAKKKKKSSVSDSTPGVKYPQAQDSQDYEKFKAMAEQLKGKGLGFGGFGGNDAVSGFTRGAVGKTLNALTKPSMAISSALTATQKELNKGQNPWNTLDDFAKGAVGGLIGKRHDGYGEYINALNDPNSHRSILGKLQNDLNPIGLGNELVRKARQMDPDKKNLLGKAAYSANVVQGATGEVVGDPLTYVGGSAVATTKGTGEQAAKEAMKEAARKAAIEQAVEHGVSGTRSIAGGVTENGTKLGNRFIREIDGIGEDAAKAVDDATLQIRGGTNEGRVLGLRDIAKTSSSRVAVNIRDNLLKPFRKYADKFLDESVSMSTKEIEKASKSNPVFEKFLEDIVNNVEEGMPKNLAAKKALEVAEATYDEVARKAYDGFQQAIANQYFNAPGIRVGSKVYSSPKIGELYDTYLAGRNPLSGISYSSQFPGVSGLINTNARAIAFRNFEDFNKLIKKEAFNVSRTDRKLLQEALEDISRPLDEELGKKYDFLKDSYDRILDSEIQSGVKSGNTSRVDNYAYTRFNGNREGIKKVRDLRKAEAKNLGHFETTGKEIAAKFKGVRQERDAFKNILYRAGKSEQAKSRAWFTNELVDKFGVTTRPLTEKQQAELGLKEIKIGHSKGYAELPVELAESIKKSGHKLYLPEQYDSLLKRFREMASDGRFDEDAQKMLRVTDWLTNKFKYGATVLYPGFHVKNMVGDIFTGILDGVGLSDYKKALEAFPEITDGPGSKFLWDSKRHYFNLGKEGKVSADKMAHMYVSDTRAGGFFNTDVANSVGRVGGGNVAQNIQSALQKGAEGIRNASELREDFGRLAHYIHVIEEETAKGSSLKEARLAAIYRLNKYHFDYGALTKIEKNFVKRVAPFYTFQRKAMPVLLESLFLSPKYLERLEKLRQAGAPTGADMASYPDWMRQVGFAKVTGGAAPLTITGNVLPSNVLDPLNETTAQGMFQDLTSQVNPYIQAPFELASGKTMFSGYNIDKTPIKTPVGELPGTLSYMLSKVQPQIGTSQQLRKKKYDNFGDRLLSDRMFLGLGTQRVSQEQRIKNLDRMSKEQTKDIEKHFNPILEKFGYKIYRSARKNGTSMRVRNINNDEVVYDGTVEGALKFIKGLTNK